MDTGGFPELAFEIQPGSRGLGHQHRLQSLDGGHSTHTAPDLDLSVFYLGLRDLCLGCLDSAEFWHAGQLSLVGHHRPGGSDQDADVGDLTGSRCACDLGDCSRRPWQSSRVDS